ncbi:MAG: ABC transporter permease [Pirellulaceae bacterium]|jgi:hypothetical protein|nr:ABC transporter permease [Pirellulaceae bacterium]
MSETIRSRLQHNPLWNLVMTRVREFVREPAAIFWVYVFPVLMMIALGVAFRDQPPEKPTVIVVAGPQSQLLQQTLEATDQFRVSVLSADEASEQLRSGKADLLIEIEPSDSSRRRGEGAGEGADGQTGGGSSTERATLTFHFDPTKPGAQLARNAADDVWQRAAGRADVVSTRDVEITEAGDRYIDFLVPGLLGLGIMGGGMWGVGFAIVDQRIRKLLKRMLATPMRKADFLGALMISRLVFTVPEVVVLLICANLIFGVGCQGDLFSLAALILLGAFEFAGLGLLIACRARTIETVSGLMNLVMLPMWIGGAVFFPAERFPEAVQPVLRILPLTALNDALREVMLEGGSLSAVAFELVLIVAWGAVSFAVALWWFRWD